MSFCRKKPCNYLTEAASRFFHNVKNVLTQNQVKPIKEMTEKEKAYEAMKENSPSFRRSGDL